LPSLHLALKTSNAVPQVTANQQPNPTMKSQDAKKETKKKPLLTAKEKKIAKQEKKKNK
jgi:hypothetical protein